MIFMKKKRGFDIPVSSGKPAKGKTLESLVQSRNARADILHYFDGELPMSIMTAKKTSRGESDISVGSYTESSAINKKPIKDPFLNRGDHGFELSNRGVRGGALSAFPQNIGKCVLRLYSERDDIVIDPFVGHNSRMELVVFEGRHYYGYDISEEFMKFNEEQAKILREDYGMNIGLHLGDSRCMD